MDCRKIIGPYQVAGITLLLLVGNVLGALAESASDYPFDQYVDGPGGMVMAAATADAAPTPSTEMPVATSPIPLPPPPPPPTIPPPPALNVTNPTCADVEANLVRYAAFIEDLVLLEKYFIVFEELLRPSLGLAIFSYPGQRWPIDDRSLSYQDIESLRVMVINSFPPGITEEVREKRLVLELLGRLREKSLFEDISKEFAELNQPKVNGTSFITLYDVRWLLGRLRAILRQCAIAPAPIPKPGEDPPPPPPIKTCCIGTDDSADDSNCKRIDKPSEGRCDHVGRQIDPYLLCAYDAEANVCRNPWKQLLEKWRKDENFDGNTCYAVELRDKNESSNLPATFGQCRRFLWHHFGHSGPDALSLHMPRIINLILGANPQATEIDINNHGCWTFSSASLYPSQWDWATRLHRYVESARLNNILINITGHQDYNTATSDPTRPIEPQPSRAGIEVRVNGGRVESRVTFYPCTSFAVECNAVNTKAVCTVEDAPRYRLMRCDKGREGNRWATVQAFATESELVAYIRQASQVVGQ